METQIFITIFLGIGELEIKHVRIYLPSLVYPTHTFTCSMSHMQMELDIAELQVLEKEAKRSNVKDLLNLEMGRLQQCVVKEESQVAGDHSHQYGDTPPTTTATPPSGHSAMVHHESIKNYG